MRVGQYETEEIDISIGRVVNGSSGDITATLDDLIAATEKTLLTEYFRIKELTAEARLESHTVSATTPTNLPKEGDPIRCAKCNEPITNEKVIKYSIRKYGEPICYKCQQKM